MDGSGGPDKQPCIATIIRICVRYGNLDILEDGYGINMFPLGRFAMKAYREDPCECFKLKGDKIVQESEAALDMKMHKGHLRDSVQAGRTA